MDTVESWFLDFASRLVEVVQRQDWPEPESEFWSAFKRALKRRGVSGRVSALAIDLLAEEQPSFLGEILPKFLEKVAEVHALDQAEARARSGVPTDDHAGAKAASKGCDRCAGEGLTILHKQASAVRGANNEVVFYCLCESGRWLASRQADRRIHDLAKFPELHGDEYRSPRYFPPEPESEGDREAAPTTGFRGRKILAPIGPVPNVGSVSRERPTQPQPRAEAS